MQQVRFPSESSALKVIVSTLVILSAFLMACTSTPEVATTPTTVTSTSTVTPTTNPTTAIPTTVPTSTPATTTATTTATPSPMPSLKITSPGDGAKVLPGDIEVNILLSDFNLIDAQGQANVPGQGHLIFYMDTSIPTSPNQPAFFSVGNYATTVMTSYIWHDVPEGTHTFGVQLVNNDDTPLEPAVFTLIEVTAATPPPANIGTLQVSAVSNMLAGDIDRIIVTIDNMEVHEPGEPWVPLTSGPTVLDLADLQRNEEILVNKDFVPGTYTQLRFDVSSVEVAVGTQSYPAVVISNSVGLVTAFDVTLGQTTRLAFGFDAPRSLSSVSSNIFAFDPVVYLSVLPTEGPQIITPSLRNGSPSVPYSENLISLGGIPSDWSITAGSLPRGIALDHNTGTISGSPTEPGQSNFTVTMTDSSSPSRKVSRDYAIRIGIQGLPVIVTRYLPSTEAGGLYSYTLEGTGGTEPYTWSWSSVPSLPSGLVLDPQTGTISGTTATAGDYGITITLSDTANPLVKDTQLIRLHIE